MNNTNLTYSETVYLFADRFISQRAVLANLDNHPTGEKIPIKSLGDLMVLAAIIFLQENELVSIQVKDVKKLLLFSGKEAFVSPSNKGEKDLSGIEKKLYFNITKETRLQDAVYNLLNNDELLPWGHIINFTKVSLVEKGYLNVTEERKFIVKVKKYELDREKLDGVESLFTEVNAVINKFRNNVEEYPVVMKAVKKGISRREEHEDFDAD